VLLLGLYGCALVFLQGCEPADKPISLPPPGDATFAELNTGIEYENTVFVNLETGVQTVVPNGSYDLAFETGADGFRIWTNGGNLFFTAPLGTTDFNTVVIPANVTNWRADHAHRHPDSTWLTRGVNPNTLRVDSVVHILDRGRVSYRNSPQRYLKFRVLAVTDTAYQIQFGLPNSTEATSTVVWVPKREGYTYTYYNFTNGVVNFAPPANEWHFSLGQYTHIYYDLVPENRYYLVRGVLTNREIGLETAVVDTLWDNYPTFDSLRANALPQFTGMFVPDAGRFGFDWKRYDFDANAYVLQARNYFLLRDRQQRVYKCQFISYNIPSRGRAGFRYQRIQ